jgi:hypothetical protein
MESLLIKVAVVFVWALAALLAQITLQRFSLDTRDSQNWKNIGPLLPGLVRVTVASGFSLFMALVCYRYLSFFQFLISQGLFYALAFMYSFLVLHESLTNLKIASIILFVPAIVLALI